MNEDRLKLDIENQLAVITMDDGKVNAMDNNWFRSMLGLLDEVEASDATALIIKGRDGIFSGGLNIKWLPTMTAAEAVEFFQVFPGFMRRIYHFPKPTVAQITGHGIAGGCILSCACDRRLAMKGANLAMNEVRVNMTIPEWAIDIVMDVIPQPQVGTLLKFGDPMTTDELHKLGVIEATFDSQSELEAAALQMVASFEGIVPSDFAGTKARVRKTLR